MRKNNSICRNWPKFVLQWGVLIAIIVMIALMGTDPEKYCPMGGLQAFVTYIVNGSLPCSMTTLQILMGFALAAAVILFSKLFCAFICPIGTVEDLLIKLRCKLHVKGAEIKAGSIADKLLRIVKYALLFVLFYTTATASELFCKNFDPYYAAATGFKGEITLWMAIVTVGLVLIGGFFIKRFWCRYICPLGAASNSLKFWMWFLILGLAYWVLSLIGVHIHWPTVLFAACLLGYLLEIFHSNPQTQLLYVIRDDEKCGKTCHSCQKKCPYNIDAPAFDGRITSVDCTLCGECVAACPTNALRIASCSKSKGCRFLPAIIIVVLLAAAIIIGRKWELPTINETWGLTEEMQTETVKIENLKSVKCYGSSMAFKARMENVRGVHGVKTYVGSHTVIITYDPKATSEEKIREEVFTPSHFRVWSPDPNQLSELKIITIRTENMYDKLDLNYFGLQLRNTGRSIFGVESEYDCPLIVKVYVSPNEEFTEDWWREITEKKSLDMPVHGGGVKSTPVDFEFVRLEKSVGTIDISTYLHNMLDEFTAEYNGRYEEGDSTVIRKRVEVYEGKPQKVYELSDQNYEKPIIKRALPYLSNYLSSQEGVIGTYLRLNSELVPSIQIRYAEPMTTERIEEMLASDIWTITYSVDDVREENARMKFEEPGRELDYSPESFEF